MRYIYSFDLSLTRSGLCIFDINGNIILICSIPTDAKLNRGKRLKQIADFVYKLLPIYPCESIVIERGFNRFNKATQAINEVNGVIKYMFYEFEPIYYAVTTIKATLLNGRASKKEIQDIILKKYPNLVFACEDESDAYSAGLTYFIKNKIINWEK